MKPRQPPRESRKVPTPAGESLEDVGGAPHGPLPIARRRFFSYEEHGNGESESLKMQGVRGDATRSRPASSARAASARSRSRTTSRTSIPRRRAGRSRPGREAFGATRTSCPSTERPRDPLEPGLTPLIRADRLAARLGLESVWIKNDAANPTHSFKDRVVAVALAKAKELGFETVACASTGNLANAVAAHAAAAGLDSYVFVPADLEEQKLLATGIYGTKLVGVNGNYDDVNRLCTRAVRDAALGVRERQPAPVLLAGIEDPRLRDGRAARLVAARTASSGRSPPARCSPSSAAGSRVDRSRDGQGRAANLQRRPARGLQPGRHRVRRGP